MTPNNTPPKCPECGAGIGAIISSDSDPISDVLNRTLLKCGTRLSRSGKASVSIDCLQRSAARKALLRAAKEVCHYCREEYATLARDVDGAYHSGAHGNKGYDTECDAASIHDLIAALEERGMEALEER